MLAGNKIFIYKHVILLGYPIKITIIINFRQIINIIK